MPLEVTVLSKKPGDHTSLQPQSAGEGGGGGGRGRGEGAGLQPLWENRCGRSVVLSTRPSPLGRNGLGWGGGGAGSPGVGLHEQAGSGGTPPGGVGWKARLQDLCLIPEASLPLLSWGVGVPSAGLTGQFFPSENPRVSRDICSGWPGHCPQRDEVLHPSLAGRCLHPQEPCTPSRPASPWGLIWSR